jgi:hypothetical protein
MPHSPAWLARENSSFYSKRVRNIEVDQLHEHVSTLKEFGGRGTGGEVIMVYLTSVPLLDTHLLAEFI